MVHSFTLTLFRHGLTRENEKRQYLGWTNAPLSRKGKLETKELAKKLKGVNPDKIITSDLIRCQQTTNLLFPNRKSLKMSDFREMHFGDFEGKSYAELKKKEEYQDWLNSSFKLSPANGESFSIFADRIEEGLAKVIDLLEPEDMNYLLVSHAGVIRFLLSNLVNSEKEFFDWQVPHGRGYQLNWENIKSFRRLEKCKSLSVVPSMEKRNG
ncbi:MAG: histidine phosphatase family protein [Atopostipes suicloacalis]|nr:histidine phosphatase family protein [Atopostipes suicloacalis]